ncbi:hypothetical protein BsWGS_21936 [Bradybaena similaris]
MVTALVFAFASTVNKSIHAVLVKICTNVGEPLVYSFYESADQAKQLSSCHFMNCCLNSAVIVSNAATRGTTSATAPTNAAKKKSASGK